MAYVFYKNHICFFLSVFYIVCVAARRL